MKNLDEINLSIKEKEALKILSNSLLSENKISKIILFGSYSRGTNDSESDIDLLVITSIQLTRNERHHITDEIFEINLKYGTNFSAIVVYEKSWEEGPYSVLPIKNEILKEVVLI
ncbi:MAG: nucleotidyltransferase domain-containing protein [bacterium]